MSGPPMVKSMGFTEPEAREVLGPTGNQESSVELKKLVQKLKSEKTEKLPGVDEVKGNKSPAAVLPEKLGFRRNSSSAASILRHRKQNMSLSASCSSDASTDSTHSRASTGRILRRSMGSGQCLKKKQQCSPKGEKLERIERGVGSECDGVVGDDSFVKKRCAWVTSNTDSLYVAFHDEEWGLPVHDDKKLFELLSFSTALAELTWPVILSKRSIFRDVFLDFDPMAVSKLSDKKITTPASPASSLLSELKLRSIVENARQICKIVDEHGSFDKYIWSFVNHKPIIGNFRYSRQVPIKTSKAETISKDLVRRGFRGVGPTVVYSFMQVAGITNDHLVNCFRYRDCITVSDLRNKDEDVTLKNETKPHEDLIELARDMMI